VAVGGDTSIAALRARGLLKPDVEVEEGEPLAALCHKGALRGGLSVAQDLAPDELVGPLCALMGGRAARLRVIDVRTKPQALVVSIEGAEETWRVKDVAGLVRRVNRVFAKDAQVKRVEVLGEWERMVQLWCVPKPQKRS
jgi:hypothetical protein